MGREKFDPLVEQRVNQKLFEGFLKTCFEVPSQAAVAMAPSTSLQCQELDEEEEQIVRYAAGFVPMSLLKKHEKGSTDRSVEFVECLSKMAVNGDESSFLSYTLEWSRTVNRGGLFEVNDEAYRLFKRIETRMQNQLRAMLNSALSVPGKREIIIDSVAGDDDVQFLWLLLSCDITDEDDAICLLKEIIGLWLTIRGFSIATSWMEEYKMKTATTQKTKGLRKSLKQKSDTKTNDDSNIGGGTQTDTQSVEEIQTEEHKVRVTMKQKVSISIKSFLKYLESVNIHTQHDFVDLFLFSKGALSGTAQVEARFLQFPRNGSREADP